MTDAVAALVRELRTTLEAQRVQIASLERQNAELRDAIVALMEPGTPRVLMGRTGIIIMDEKWVKK